jgi:hypothetical protein
MLNGTEPAEGKFRHRVITAAEAALAAEGSVGPLELFQHMGLLQHCHVDGWRKGNEHYRVLEAWIQVGPEKFAKTLRYFGEWVQARGLRTIESPYTRRTPQGLQTLQVTADGEPEREQFYRTRYAPADLSERKAKRLEEKLSKPPDLVVFEKVSEEGNCQECGVELPQGSYLFMEKGQPLCLECADLDHLIFLSAGDAALSRRARKHSPLSAVVVRFVRSRKRYQRQGLLVHPRALEQAEAECAADAPERAARRVQNASRRQAEDVEFVAAVAQAIGERFPGCPAEEAQAIAQHTGLRGSGRVGRSAAGRALDPRAVELAVIAHVRHVHTNYDTLLMKGSDRMDARSLVREKIEHVLDRWKTGSARTDR